MPKRVIDGEALWRSDKLAQIRPEWIKAEYANLIPLALANGSFEAGDRRIWSTVYSYNRPEIMLEKVVEMLAELERVKLLFRWTDAAGKLWGFLPGIEKPGRLPGKSRRGRNEAVGEDPPDEELRKFLDSKCFPIGNEKLLGFGSGFGSGSGSGSGKNPSSEQEPCSDTVSPLPKKPRSQPSREAVKLAALLRDEILRNSRDFKITPAQLRSWEATADRMLRLDERDPEHAVALIRWSQRDDFWMRNILSMEKFRKQFDQLAAKARGKMNGSPTVGKPAETNKPIHVIDTSVPIAQPDGLALLARLKRESQAKRSGEAPPKQNFGALDDEPSAMAGGVK